MDFPSYPLILIFLSCIALSQQQCTRHGVSCPDYTVIKTHENYEERLYPSLVWVSTSAKAKARSEVSRRLIKRLYAYIQGENDRELQMEMMVPVRTTKFPGENQNTYIISIALPSEYQDNPPVPKNNLVTVQREPQKTYYAWSFGGLIRDESQWDEKAQALTNSLEGGDVANTTFYFWALYDSPWTPAEERLNEVWLLPSENQTE